MTVKSFASGDIEAKTFFDEHGWVVIETLDEEGVQKLRQWVEEISSWRDEDGHWLHYREMTDFGPKLCRTENFTPFHDGFRKLLTTGVMLDSASLLMGEQAVLYKEKINYKLIGALVMHLTKMRRLIHLSIVTSRAWLQLMMLTK